MPYGQTSNARKATSMPGDIKLRAETEAGKRKEKYETDKSERPLSSLKKIMEGYEGFKKLADNEKKKSY